MIIVTEYYDDFPLGHHTNDKTGPSKKPLKL
jgi:hypothetical protein